VRDDASLWFRLVGDPQAGKLLRDTAVGYLVTCCNGALEDAGLSLGDIDHFVFNTPVAWYSKFCARTLGVPSDKPVINMYPKYGNMGPNLLGANLYHAAREFGIEKGDRILMYSVGSVSSAGAMVLRWGDVALGPPPEPHSVVCD
jgi:3-oxoacyl-[acyl-carrier-protein] synthase-3